MKLTMMLTQKVLKTFKVFGMFHKAIKFKEKMKYRKQSQKCYSIAVQIAELDHSDRDISFQFSEARDIILAIAHRFEDMEDDLFAEE